MRKNIMFYSFSPQKFCNWEVAAFMFFFSWNVRAWVLCYSMLYVKSKFTGGRLKLAHMFSPASLSLDWPGHERKPLQMTESGVSSCPDKKLLQGADLSSAVHHPFFLSVLPPVDPADGEESEQCQQLSWDRESPRGQAGSGVSQWCVCVQSGLTGSPAQRDPEALLCPCPDVPSCPHTPCGDTDVVGACLTFPCLQCYGTAFMCQENGRLHVAF